ncbi:phosphotransferase [Glycomyces sp. NPDC047010]|uniref:phosphotransferase n=1 Tax=Glycomyces sp. NPDC047010 TaxID=3155023 RepID=UPI0033F880E2
MNAVEDREVVEEINRRTGAGLTVTGRAEFGKLGGAIYAEWPDGRPAVVTRFLGTAAEARRTAETLAHVRDRGLPVPRHDLVAELDDGVCFVQERLPSAPPRPLSPARMEAIVAVNDRFAGALADRPEVPAPPLTRRRDPDPRHRTLADHGPRGRRVLDLVNRATERAQAEPAGTDLVHTDLSGANVLFDAAGTATGVVDWNLGAFRGDRHFALVQTRFDREWFVQSPGADPVETAAAHRLDAILAERIAPDTLRRYWAQWLLHHLDRAIRTAGPEAVAWHLDLAESRLA